MDVGFIVFSPVIILLFGYDATWAMLGLCTLGILTGFAISYNINNYEPLSESRIRCTGGTPSHSGLPMIDKTWRIGTGMHLGPCEVMDIIGLTTIYEVNAASDNEKTRAAGAYLKEHYIDKGKLGRASGEGFYKYVAARSTAKP